MINYSRDSLILNCIRASFTLGRCRIFSMLLSIVVLIPIRVSYHTFVCKRIFVLILF